MKAEPKAQPVPAKGDDIGWRHFPEFEKLLSAESQAPFLSQVEKTCRQLNDILQASSGADKIRAQAAMTAYGRSLDLLRLLTEMRDRSAEEK